MSYQRFAEFYDRLTGNVNYAGYAGRIAAIIKKLRLESLSIVELACGTFSVGLFLIEKGFSVCGLDTSEEMLQRAAKKAFERGFSVDLFNADMRDFTLPRPADVFICTLDGLNHLDGFYDVMRTFYAVGRNIKKGGLFIFDMNTPYKHEKILGNNSFIYDLGDVYCGWQNRYDPRDCSVGITLDIFAKSGGAGFERITESFRETAYPEKQVINGLKAAGFEVLGSFDGISSARPNPHTERILYVARSI